MASRFVEAEGKKDFLKNTELNFNPALFGANFIHHFAVDK